MNVMGKEQILSVTMPFEVRFSEVDSMGVVWHGNYAIYFEDAREAFGAKYGLQYLMMYDKGFFEPIVELSFKYKHPMIYGMKPEVEIIYRPTEAAKIIFDYARWSGAAANAFCIPSQPTFALGESMSPSDRRSIPLPGSKLRPSFTQ